MTRRLKVTSPSHFHRIARSYRCLGDIIAWATANILKLNDNKIELMLVTPIRTKHLHNRPTSITIGNAQIPFNRSVKNLSMTLNCHLTMNEKISIA